mmetsp:Transcript_18582/g.43821  ORF Transcript_18582/g.43821 Transcript_18582/m.43821 type:complete len:93 (-) Transcript_18582:153-431(-)
MCNSSAVTCSRGTSGACNGKWGMYSYRVIVSIHALPMPGESLPPDASAPTYYCWVGQNFDIISIHIPADIHQAVHTQIRQDLLCAVRATPAN